MGFYFLNRTMCDALEEIRALDKAKNYGGLLGLVEEIQSMANRMEAKLNDVKDLERLTKEISKARKKLKTLKGDDDEE